jgi:hypothetical protein
MSNRELGFSVEAGKEHVVFSNSFGDELGVIAITNTSVSVMRVLCYEDGKNTSQGPETIAVLPGCGGTYCGNRIVIRASENQVKGTATFLSLT